MPSLSETISDADFPLRGSRSCCPYSHHQTSGKFVVWRFCRFWKMNFLCSGWQEVNNKPHGEELCKNPVDVHAFASNQKTFHSKKRSGWKTIYLWCRLSPWLGIKQCWLWGPHWPNEAREGAIHHPLFWQPVKDRGFQGPPLCLVNIDLDMPWLGGTFCLPSTETSGKTVGKTEGNFVWKCRHFGCVKIPLGAPRLHL